MEVCQSGFIQAATLRPLQVMTNVFEYGIPRTSTANKFSITRNGARLLQLTWISVEPSVEGTSTSVCVGTGRGSVDLCPMSKDSTVSFASST